MTVTADTQVIPSSRPINVTPSRKATAQGMLRLAGELQRTHGKTGVHQHLQDAAGQVRAGNDEGALRHLRAAVWSLQPQSLHRHGLHDDRHHIAARHALEGVVRHHHLVRDIIDADARNREVIARQAMEDAYGSPPPPSYGGDPGALAQRPTARQPGGDRALNAPARANAGRTDPAVADPQGRQPRGSRQFAASWDEVCAVIDLAAGNHVCDHFELDKQASRNHGPGAELKTPARLKGKIVQAARTWDELAGVIELATVPVRPYRRTVQTRSGPRVEVVRGHTEQTRGIAAQAAGEEEDEAKPTVDRSHIRGWIPREKWLKGQQEWIAKGKAARAAREAAEAAPQAAGWHSVEAPPGHHVNAVDHAEREVGPRVGKESIRKTSAELADLVQDRGHANFAENSPLTARTAEELKRRGVNPEIQQVKVLGEKRIHVYDPAQRRPAGENGPPGDEYGVLPGRAQKVADRIMADMGLVRSPFSGFSDGDLRGAESEMNARLKEGGGDPAAIRTRLKAIRAVLRQHDKAAESRAAPKAHDEVAAKRAAAAEENARADIARFRQGPAKERTAAQKTAAQAGAAAGRALKEPARRARPGAGSEKQLQLLSEREHGADKTSGEMKPGDMQEGHQAIGQAPAGILPNETHRDIGGWSVRGSFSDPWWMAGPGGKFAVSRRWRSKAQDSYRWENGKYVTAHIPAQDVRVLTPVNSKGAALARTWDEVAAVIDLSARTPMLEVTPAPLGRPGGPGLYWLKGNKHSDYLEQVVKALIEKRGMPKSRAYAIAWGALRRWAGGRGHVHPEVRAAAAGGLAKEAEASARARAAHGHSVTWEDITGAVELAAVRGSDGTTWADVAAVLDLAVVNVRTYQRTVNTPNGPRVQTVAQHPQNFRQGMGQPAPAGRTQAAAKTQRAPGRQSPAQRAVQKQHLLATAAYDRRQAALLGVEESAFNAALMRSLYGNNTTQAQKGATTAAQAGATTQATAGSTVTRTQSAAAAATQAGIPAAQVSQAQARAQAAAAKMTVPQIQAAVAQLRTDINWYNAQAATLTAQAAKL